MQWPNFTEFFSTWLRGIAYGKEDGTAGATQRAQPILVDSNGVVQVNGQPNSTITQLADENIAVVGGGGIEYGGWVNIVGYKMVVWFFNNIGANATTQYGASFASGLGGAGIVANTGAIAHALAAGAQEYIDTIGSVATINRNTSWAPIGARSIRIGFNGAAGTTINVIHLGVNWS